MKIIEARTRGNYNFFPIIDEVLVFSDYAARARKGKLARLVSTAAISHLIMGAHDAMSAMTADNGRDERT